MVEDVYRRLAYKLDEIPNGFPETESGIELKLLTKIFTDVASAWSVSKLVHRQPSEARLM